MADFESGSMTKLMRYDTSFYADQAAISARSAAAVVGVLIDEIAPNSVVDVGCGVGTWLAEFTARGVADIFGIDGSAAAAELLRIPRDHFRSVDLGATFHLDRVFDMAMSLEVAEHLPADRAASFVADLVRLAPVVVFGAAVPFQGGTGHVNEQWPSYWAALFAAHGYHPYDLVRPAVWTDDDVAAHYAQNVLVYMHESSSLAQQDAATEPIDLVHPRVFSRKLRHPHLASLAQHLPDTVKNRVTARLRRLPFFRTI